MLSSAVLSAVCFVSVGSVTVRISDHQKIISSFIFGRTHIVKNAKVVIRSKAAQLSERKLIHHSKLLSKDFTLYSRTQWLLTELPMAEDSIDSGISSETSQYSTRFAKEQFVERQLSTTEDYYESIFPGKHPDFICSELFRKFEEIKQSDISCSQESSQIRSYLPVSSGSIPSNMSYYPEEYDNQQQDPRFLNSRAVHFAENTQPYPNQLSRSLIGSRRVGPQPTRSRPPLLRNYSTRDYAYLPPLFNTPLATTASSVLANPSTSQLREQNVRDQHEYRQHLTEQRQAPVNVTELYGQPATGQSNQQRGSNTAMPLLRSATQSIASSLYQRMLTGSGMPNRCLSQTRWSDSDMVSGDERQTRQTVQEQKLRQAQKHAAVAAAAAAAAMAIASIQAGTSSINPREPQNLPSSTRKTFQARPTQYRSCYSSGEEDIFPMLNIRPSLCRQDPLSIAHPPPQRVPSSCVNQAAIDQLSHIQPLNVPSEDYANYQSLEALLGRLHTQPPAPAPYYPTGSQNPLGKQELRAENQPAPEESYSVYSMVSSSTLQPSRSVISQGHQVVEKPELTAPVNVRLPDVPTEFRIEEDFSDYFPLSSERYLANQGPSQAGSSCNYDSSPGTQPECCSKTGTRSPFVNGLLAIHLVAGNGLSSSQVPLRDLYCVIEVDSMRKARSMIRTSTGFFEWKEMFEIDLEENRFVAFLLYQWDARTKHRLCFYGGIDLRTLINRLALITTNPSQCTSRYLLSPGLELLHTPFDKIALQLEPRGILYLEFAYHTLDRIFHRYQPAVSTSLQHSSISDDVLFGVPIEELMERERLVNRLLFANIHSRSLSDVIYLPLFIRKCVEEIERRGIEIAGIYRLAGSVWMKLQLRELFNRVTKNTLRALYQGDKHSLDRIIKSVDLSPERVPDVHAITALLKDFLRELPEPLFTSALYPMFYDAMQVTMPEFSQRSTKLMLNILDCLPIGNQEIILFLLDHFKRVTNLQEVNRMDIKSLSTCLASVLFYPAPNFARTLDPSILDPHKMADILQFILEIWPTDRSRRPTQTVRGRESPTKYVTDFSEDLRSRRHRSFEQQTQGLDRTHQGYYRNTRSTASGPAAPGPRVQHTSPVSHRSARITARSTDDYGGLESERRGRVKFSSLSGHVDRLGIPAELAELGPGDVRSVPFGRSGPSTTHQRRRVNSQSEITGRRELDVDRSHPRQRLQDIPASGSTGTDSGTRSSFSAGGSVGTGSNRPSNLINRGPRPDNLRSTSRDRADYVHSSRLPSLSRR